MFANSWMIWVFWGGLFSEMLQGYVAVLFDFQFALGIAFDSFEAKLEQVQVFAFWLPLALLQAFLFQRRDEN